MTTYYDPQRRGVPVSERSPRGARLALLLQRLDSALINLHIALNPERLPFDDRGPWRHNEVMWEANLASSLSRQAMRLLTESERTGRVDEDPVVRAIRVRCDRDLAGVLSEAQLRRRVSRYALQRLLCERCGRPLEDHRDGSACRAWAWWTREVGVFTDPLVGE